MPDWGDLFNETELARTSRPSGKYAGMSPEEIVKLNRYAQGGDVPATALLAAPYEGLKAIEQKTGIPALSGPGKLLRAMGAPVALPNKHTSPASLDHVKYAWLGAIDRILGRNPRMG